MILKTVNTYIDNPSVCSNGCTALCGMIGPNGNSNNNKRFHLCLFTVNNDLAERVIETVVNTISTNINNAEVCENGFNTLSAMWAFSKEFLFFYYLT